MQRRESPIDEANIADAEVVLMDGARGVATLDVAELPPLARSGARVDARISFMDQQRPRMRTRLEVQDMMQQSSVGGLRCTVSSMSRICGKLAGLKLRLGLMRTLRDRPQLVRRRILAMGSMSEGAGPTDDDIAACRQQFCADLGLPPFCRPRLCGLWIGLVRWWIQTARDPDIDIEEWLEHGAPMNLKRCIPVRGIFPTTAMDDESYVDPDSLRTPWDWSEDTSIESYGIAEKQMQHYESKGFVTGYGSWEELCAALGCEPILSAVRVLKK
eukprot:1977115-Amphidinium_carterae.1